MANHGEKRFGYGYVNRKGGLTTGFWDLDGARSAAKRADERYKSWAPHRAVELWWHEIKNEEATDARP